MFSNGVNFPEDVIREILSRMDLSTVIDMKLVSKDWRLSIMSPNFAKFYNNQNIDIMYHRRPICPLIFRCLPPTIMMLFQNNSRNPLQLEVSRSLFHNSALRFIGSVNGILCFHRLDLELPPRSCWTFWPICLCNPLTKQYKEVETSYPLCAGS